MEYAVIECLFDYLSFVSMLNTKITCKLEYEVFNYICLRLKKNSFTLGRIC